MDVPPSESHEPTGLELLSTKAMYRPIDLPDLSEIEPDTYERKSEVKTEITIKGVTYPCTLTFERLEEALYQQEYQKMQLHLELFDPINHTRIAVFKGALNCAATDASHKKQNATYWRIYTRKVDESARGKGIGSACLEVYEHLCRQIGKEYPALNADHIRICTMLASLTCLLISKTWLDANNLSDYARSAGVDFGYLPRPGDERNVRTVLEAGTEQLDDLTGRNIPQIELIKKL